jgi:hypothetical protein
MALPSSGPYTSLLVGFFGNLDTDEQGALWQAFKTKNGFTTDPASNDIDALVKFSDFIQATYNNEQTMALSPEEIHKRQLLFSLYDLIVTMMQSIQQTVGVTGQNITFLGRYQRVYTDMMSREAGAFYIGGTRDRPPINPATGKVYIEDLTKWKLGYGSITMAEYLETALLAKPTAAAPLEIHSDFVEDNQNRLLFSATDSSITFTFVAQLTEQNAEGEDVQVEHPVSFTTSFSPSDSFEDKMAIATQGFTTLYNSAVPGTAKTVSDFINDPAQPIRIPFGVVTDESIFINKALTGIGDSEEIAKQSAASQARAAKNSLLQQFLENSRSRREILANQADTERSLMDQSQQGISTSSNILQATIKQLTTILDSIFRIE